MIEKQSEIKIFFQVQYIESFFYSKLFSQPFYLTLELLFYIRQKL